MKIRRLGLSVLALILIVGISQGAWAWAGTAGDEGWASTTHHDDSNHAAITDHASIESAENGEGELADQDVEQEPEQQPNKHEEPMSAENAGSTASDEQAQEDGSTASDEQASDDRSTASDEQTPADGSAASDEQASDDESATEEQAASEANEKPKTVDLTPNAKSSILMDVDTGTIIYEKNVHERVPPASITKIMTMLLIMEAIDQKKITLDEMVTASERAASMGGSQIFLEAGEQMSVRDLLKGIAMASGNDASVALAEKIAGSEEMFVQMMNDKAEQLGMTNTHFVNSNGLPAENHYSTAHDIAIMSRELLKYEMITEFTGKYQDYLRTESDNPFWLVNTNKLVRFYSGVDGLKTGYTSEAKFCLSATAKKDNLRVIAVVLGEPNTKSRNAEVASLFDYAFSQYTNMPIFKTGDTIGTFDIEKGEVNKLTVTAKHPYSVLLRKGEGTDDIRHELVIDDNIQAPVEHGQPIGKIVVYKGDQVVTEFPLTSPQDVAKAGWWTLFKRTAGKIFFVGD